MRPIAETTTGPLLANSMAHEAAMESDPMRIAKPLSSTDLMVRDLPDQPKNVSILTNWKPSDRRKEGRLSFKAYEQAGITCPTDVWSYQRLFIEQRRDAGNLLAARAKVDA